MSQEEVEEGNGEGPLVRSLSMSRNLAYSVVGEVPHMIRLPPDEEEQESEIERPWWRGSASSTGGQGMRKSSSTSSLKHLSKATSDSNFEDSYQYQSEEMGRRRSIGVIKNPSRSQGLFHTISTDSIINSNKNSANPNPRHLPPIVKGTRRNDLLVGIVVSRWDNIVGPQSVYLWTEELTSVFYPINLPAELGKVVKYVTDHTVDHQTATGKCIHPSVQRTTLCIVPDLNLAYLSLSIRVPNDLDAILEFQTSAPMTGNSPDHPALTMPHSISVLYNLKRFNQFLLIRPVMLNWLLEFGPQIGVLLCKGTLQGSMVNSWCAELCKTITAIQTCWAQDFTDFGDSSIYPSSIDRGEIDLSYSISSRKFPDLANNNNINHNNNIDDNKFNSDMGYLLPNNTLVPKLCLATMLTSHLSSFASSIVAGNDCLLVNQIIRFLLCFSTAEEGYCSRYSLAALPDTYMKGLYVQGLVIGGIGEQSISYKQVVTNRIPLTKIELGSKIKVKQTGITTHIQEKEVVVMQELNKLWSSSVSPVQSAEAFPNVVKDVAGFVSQFLTELEMLPPDRRYGRLLLFRRSLHAKAMSLTTYLHSIKHKPFRERTKLQQLIPQILGCDNAEFLIVQVAAEKIRPGVMSILLHFEDPEIV